MIGICCCLFSQSPTRSGPTNQTNVIIISLGCKLIAICTIFLTNNALHALFFRDLAPDVAKWGESADRLSPLFSYRVRTPSPKGYSAIAWR